MTPRRRPLLPALVTVLALLAHPLQAGELNRVLPMPDSPGYVRECGSCHTAYAPAFLPARSWRRLMGELERHFGDDASLAQPERDLLMSQLEALAGDSAHAVAAIAARDARVAPSQTPLRLTEMPYFAFMHDEVPASIWARARVGRKSNCGACHGRADEGRYFEREIGIPR